MKAKILFLISLILSVYSASAVEWEEISVNVPGHANSYDINGDTIIAGDTYLIKSVDGGKTFKKINKYFDHGVERDLSEYVSRVSRIFKTRSGILFANCQIDTTGENLNHPEYYRSCLLSSEDNGETWTKSEFRGVKYLLLDPLYHIIDADDYLFLARTDEGKYDYVDYYISTDRGKVWNIIDTSLFQYSGFGLIMPTDITNTIYFTFLNYDENLKKHLLKNVLFDLSTFEYTMTDVNFELHATEPCTHKYVGYNQLDTVLYESYDYGVSWDTLAVMSDLLNQFGGWKENSNKYFEKLITEGDCIAILYRIGHTVRTSTNVCLYSLDAGQTWECMKQEDYSMFDEPAANFDFEYYLNPVFNNGVIYHYDASRLIYQYASNNDTLKKIDIPSSVIRQYRESGDKKNYVSNNQSPLCFEKDNRFTVQENARTAYLDRDGGGYYISELFWNSYLPTYFDREGNLTELNKEETWGGSNFFKTGHYLSNSKKLYYKGKYINTIPQEYTFISVADMKNVYAFKENPKEVRNYLLMKIDLDDGSEVNMNKSVFAYYNDGYRVSIDTDGQNILIHHKDGIEISRDNGISWETVLYESDNLDIITKVNKNDLYLRNRKALLRSTDGQTWVDILENISTGFIYNFEFDQKNRIVVYSTNGLFRSKEPVSVEDNSEYLANINIYPNPTSDIINIESAESIANIELYNLSGELLSKQNGLTIDATDLANGTYFIKMQVGEKSIYKQFIVER